MTFSNLESDLFPHSVPHILQIPAPWAHIYRFLGLSFSGNEYEKYSLEINIKL